MADITRHRSSRDGGFSLVELAVVLMAAAVIAAMAIPFFAYRNASPDLRLNSDLPSAPQLGRQTSNRDAKSELIAVLLAQKNYWLETGDYSENAADLVAIDPTIDVSASPALGVTIKLAETSADTVCMTRQSASGATFSVWESSTGGTFYGVADLSRSCPTASPVGYAQSGW